jgi:hypothetical protein
MAALASALRPITPGSLALAFRFATPSAPLGVPSRQMQAEVLSRAPKRGAPPDYGEACLEFTA